MVSVGKIWGILKLGGEFFLFFGLVFGGVPLVQRSGVLGRAEALAPHVVEHPCHSAVSELPSDSEQILVPDALEAKQLLKLPAVGVGQSVPKGLRLWDQEFFVDLKRLQGIERLLGTS